MYSGAVQLEASNLQNALTNSPELTVCNKISGAVQLRSPSTPSFLCPQLTSKKLRGHIGLGLSVQSVSLSVCDA